MENSTRCSPIAEMLVSSAWVLKKPLAATWKFSKKYSVSGFLNLRRSPWKVTRWSMRQIAKGSVLPR